MMPSFKAKRGRFMGSLATLVHALGLKKMRIRRSDRDESLVDKKTRTLPQGMGN